MKQSESEDVMQVSMIVLQRADLWPPGRHIFPTSRQVYGLEQFILCGKVVQSDFLYI